METVYTQVGRGPRAEAGDSGTEIGNTQVGGGPRAGVSASAGAGAMVGLVASVWDDGGEGAYTRGMGRGYRIREGRGINIFHRNKRQILSL